MRFAFGTMSLREISDVHVVRELHKHNVGCHMLVRKIALAILCHRTPQSPDRIVRSWRSSCAGRLACL